MILSKFESIVSVLQSKDDIRLKLRDILCALGKSCTLKCLSQGARAPATSSIAKTPPSTARTDDVTENMVKYLVA